jgi:AraC-like DNA-binding protein
MYILPNDFLEKNDIINLDNIVFSKYSTRTKNEKTNIRLTTHCMIILLSGKKIIDFENKRSDFTSRNIIFLTQNNYFMSEFITDGKIYNALLVYFNDKFIEDFILKYQINLQTVKRDIDIFSIDYNNDNIYKLNINLLECYIKANDKKLLKLKIEELFLNSLDNQDFLSFLNSTKNTSIKRIQYILESNLDTIETITDMCNLTKITPNKLRSYFLKNYNQNPKKWLNSKRLQKAMVLLKTTDKSITDISHKCGYATISWFINCFKAKYNQTPKEIRHNL